MKRTDISPDELDRPDWNSLLNNYSKHDIGEAYFRGRAEEMGLDLEQWGIDKRHDDDGLIFDNKMDLKLYDEDDELAGICDVKTKSSENWLGVFNARHLTHYAEHAEEHDVPVFVYMTMVDAEAEEVGETDFLFEVPTDWPWERYADHFDRDSAHRENVVADIRDDCPIVERSFRAPDGNSVVKVGDDCRRNFTWMRENVAGNR